MLPLRTGPRRLPRRTGLRMLPLGLTLPRGEDILRCTTLGGFIATLGGYMTHSRLPDRVRELGLLTSSFGEDCEDSTLVGREPGWCLASTTFGGWMSDSGTHALWLPH